MHTVSRSLGANDKTTYSPAPRKQRHLRREDSEGIFVCADSQARSHRVIFQQAHCPKTNSQEVEQEFEPEVEMFKRREPHFSYESTVPAYAEEQAQLAPCAKSVSPMMALRGGSALLAVKRSALGSRRTR
jgi:hypothetical protein